jgi:hypothetical protein
VAGSTLAATLVSSKSTNFHANYSMKSIGGPGALEALNDGLIQVSISVLIHSVATVVAGSFLQVPSLVLLLTLSHHFLLIPVKNSYCIEVDW